MNSCIQTQTHSNSYGKLDGRKKVKKAPLWK